MSLWTPGVDVSHWQGEISWPQVKDAGIGFAYIKATDGEYFLDSHFRVNWSESRHEGVLRGAYHFFRPIDVDAQVRSLIAAIDDDPGELPPALDLEVGPMDQAELENALLWLESIEAHYCRIPVLYVDRSVAQGITDERFARYPLWLADYSSVTPGSGLTEPVIPGSVIQAIWTFWQHTPAGKISGIPNQVDLDWFNGTPDQLLKVGRLPT